jgi:hypothetical protein
VCLRVESFVASYHVFIIKYSTFKIKSTFCTLVYDIIVMIVWYTFVLDYEYVVMTMCTGDCTDCSSDESVYSCWY